MNPQRRFGELLVERGFISAEQLRAALRIQTHEKKRLGQLLVDMGALSVDQLNWALSDLIGVPYVELTEDMVDLDLARTMPEEVLRRHQAVPVLRVGNELTVILADPTDRQAVAELEALGAATVRTAMASTETVGRLLDKAFPRSARGGERGRYTPIGTLSVPTGADVTGVGQVYALLVGAFREGATEIHLEPLPQEIRVRYRIDGALTERPRLPRALLGPILFRLRILAGLRGESLPAEAHVRTQFDRQDAELDLLFFPTLYGEAVTVSIWRRGADAPTLDALSLSPEARDVIAGMLAPEGGLVLVTGWESRARAGLLYAMARAVASPGRKVLTLERTVSFVVPDFVQVELAGGDIGAAIATVLSQPADVALVEDVGSVPACVAALTSAERGGLVLGGLAVATNAAALSHLLALDVPRVPLLAATRGLVHVRQGGLRSWVEPFPLTDELRRELDGRINGRR